MPAFKAFAQSASQNGSLKLIAADPNSNGTVYMDTGVARIGNVPLTTVATATVKALRQTLGKGGSVTSKKVKLADGPAYVLHLARKGSPNETDEYLFVKDQVEYVIVFVATSKNWKKYGPVFAQSAQSFRIMPSPDLSKIVLKGTQVGSGYKLTTFPFGNSFIGEATLDLCGGSYASETLRTGRLQVRYTRPGKSVAVSNEVVTYAGAGAAAGAAGGRERRAGVRAQARRPPVRRAERDLQGLAAHRPEAPGGLGRREARDHGLGRQEEGHADRCRRLPGAGQHPLGRLHVRRQGHHVRRRAADRLPRSRAERAQPRRRLAREPRRRRRTRAGRR